MAALAERSFHSWGVLSFINWFYGNAETEFPRIARAFTPMRDCNMGLGDKSRRVGSVGTGHGCESKSIVVGRRLKKMQKNATPFIAARVTRIAVPSGVKVRRRRGD